MTLKNTAVFAQTPQTAQAVVSNTCADRRHLARQ